MTSGAHRPLFSRLGIEYLESNRYRPESLGRADVRRTRYYRFNRGEFDELADRHGCALRGGDSLPRLEVRFIGGVLGWGLFALESIPVGALVGEYTGIVRRARHGRALPGGGYTTDYAWGFPKVRSIGFELEIDAREAGGLLRFANHAGDPNAEPDHFPLDGRWRIVFVARHAIAPDQEITVDYGEAYWSLGYRELVAR